jgi:hypothetical protein
MATIKTRSGRLIKRPNIVYVPDCENLVDDYASHEYNSDDDGASDIATDDEMYDSDSDVQNPRAITIDEDADENGNLRGFVADSDEESDSEYYEDEEEYETSDGEDDDYDDVSDGSEA